MNDRIRKAPMRTAFVAIGSNVGDRLEHLRFAAASLGKLPMSEVIARSRIYETAPMGPAQFAFLNAAVAVRTPAAPLPLLDVLLQIERARGRSRREKWGPRTLDLDLIAMLDEHGAPVLVEHPRLTLPHPHAQQRDFVLRPLLDLLGRGAPALRLEEQRLDALLAHLDPTTATIERATDLEL